MNFCKTSKRLNFRQTILSKIAASPEHSVFFISDFTDIAAMETVRKALDEARRQGLVVRLAHGIYVKPEESKFGIIPPPLEMIASELAKRDRVQIMPTGHTAENILGLSTQVPLVLSFLTTGSTRTVKIGNSIIRFRHAAPRNFAYQGKTVPLIVQAFKELGTANIGEHELNIVADYLSNAPDKETHASDLLMAPIWIQKFVKPLLQRHAL